MTRTCLICWLALLGVLAVARAGEAPPLVASSHPVSLGMSLRAGVFTLDVQAAVASTVRVYCPVTPGVMHVSGLSQPVAVVYDPGKRTLQLSVPAGKLRLVVRPL